MITNEAVTDTETRPSEVLTLVADERRRAVLRSLEQADDEPVDVAELADRVADRIERTGPVDHGHRDRIHVNLHHNHLPKLAAGGLVRYDGEAGHVRRIDDEFTEQLLDVIDGSDAVE